MPGVRERWAQVGGQLTEIGQQDSPEKKGDDMLVRHERFGRTPEECQPRRRGDGVVFAELSMAGLPGYFADFREDRHRPKPWAKHVTPARIAPCHTRKKREPPAAANR